MGFEITSVAPETLLELYRKMLEIRLVELKIEELYPQDEMKTPIHPCIGQEAIAAGVCANLEKKDYVFSNHRSHGHYLAKGGDLKAMIAELYNRETGCSRGRGGSMHLVDVEAGIPGTSAIVGGGIPLAAGAALASKLRGDNAVSVAFFGDGASEEGVLYESLLFAVLKKLPVVFVCENNSYSVCSPIKSRQGNEIYRRAAGFSLPSCRVDGNNVAQVYLAAREAVNRARSGEGPSFIECVTYRLRDHHGTKTGVDVGYQPIAEYEQWLKRCPIENLGKYLVEQGMITPLEIGEWQERFKVQIEEAFKFAQSSPLPEPEGLTRGLFA